MDEEGQVKQGYLANALYCFETAHHFWYPALDCQVYNFSREEQTLQLTGVMTF
jgi:hypothetical protein